MSFRAVALPLAAQQGFAALAAYAVLTAFAVLPILAALLAGCSMTERSPAPLPFGEVAVVANDAKLAALARKKAHSLPKSGDKPAVLSLEEHFSSSVASRGTEGEADKLRFDYSLGYSLSNDEGLVHSGTWRHSRTVANDERTALANRRSRELVIGQIRARAISALFRELGLISIE